MAERITASLVCEEFDKIMFAVFGEKIVHKAQAMYLNNSVLTIASLSPIISQEIKLHELELIDKVNRKFQGEIVKRLRLLI